MNDPVLEYQKGTRTSKWALAIFVASILAAAGFILIVPAVLVFLGALVIRGNLGKRTDLHGGGMASAAVIISGISILVGLLTLILLPSMATTRHGGHASTCAANLRGITQSMNVYAADGDVYPIVASSFTSTLAAALPGTPAPPDTLLSNKPGGLYRGATVGNVCQSMWILVIGGQVAPKQFICPDDPFKGAGASSMVPGSSNHYANFSDDMAYSYSFAFMWDGTGKIGGWWRSDTDAGLPLIADMAPANGTGKPKANTLDGTSKSANSFNHNRDGQNVGFGDGHAEFARLANVGENSDNIYSGNGAGGPSAFGTTAASAGDPHITGGSKGNWDIVLVPAEDGVSHARK